MGTLGQPGPRKSVRHGTSGSHTETPSSRTGPLFCFVYACSLCLEGCVPHLSSGGCFLMCIGSPCDWTFGVQ